MRLRHYFAMGYTLGMLTGCSQPSSEAKLDGPTRNSLAAFKAVSLGFYYGCGLTNSGHIFCFGNNADNQLLVPPDVFASISVGPFHGCGVRDDGIGICWGNNSSGETDVPSDKFARIKVSQEYSKLDNNQFPPAFSCGLTLIGELKCWGDNQYSLGKAVSVPAYDANDPFVDFDVNIQHGCAVKKSGEVKCWGNTGSCKDIGSPNCGAINPPTDKIFTAVSVGYTFSCGLTRDAHAKCWGSNFAKETSVPSKTLFAAISTGFLHGCGIEQGSHEAVCWGSTVFDLNRPPKGPFAAIASGNSTTCGVLENGSLSCWGQNNYGQGKPPTVDPSKPVQIAAGGSLYAYVRADGGIVPGLTGIFDKPYRTVSVGETRTCVIDVNGQLYCPDGPQNVKGNFKLVANSDLVSCAIDDKSALSCWLQQDATETAIEVPGKYKAIAVSDRRLCAITLDGKLGCYDSTQVQIPLLERAGPYKSVGLTPQTGCALKTSGTSDCFFISAPKARIPQVDKEFRLLSMSNWYACGTTLSGSIFCWIPGSSGSIEIPGQYRDLAVGANHVLGIGLDNKISCTNFVAESPSCPAL